MSYREVKGFIEKMCLLGYPRLISRDNFLSTNFPLVAEILHWFCERLDPSHGISMNIDTEQDRVNFIASAVQYLNSKLQVKLTAKRLYQADNMAVRELLAVANVLVMALKMAEKPDLNNDAHPSYGLNKQADDVKELRQLASEITSQGAAIYDFLANEATLRHQRNQVLQRNYELSQVESALQTQMLNMDQQIQQTQQAIDNIAGNEAQLDQKIEKKTLELQRLRKRLETMKNIRPPFMDEFDKLEAELRLCYEAYVNKFRCLSYLEQQLQELEKNEQQELEERQATARKMAERLRQEETLQALEAAVGGVWEGGQDFDFSPQDSIDQTGDLSNPQNKNRPRNSGRRLAATKTAEAMSRIAMVRSVESDSDLEDDDDDDDDENEEKAAASASATNLHERPTTTHSDSDVTIDEWHNEDRTWEVGTTRNSAPTDNLLIRPTPAHIAEDDF